MSWTPSLPCLTARRSGSRPGRDRRAARGGTSSRPSPASADRAGSRSPRRRRAGRSALPAPFAAGTGANPSSVRNLLISRTRFGSSSTTRTLDGMRLQCMPIDRPAAARSVACHATTRVPADRRRRLDGAGAPSTAALRRSPAATVLYDDRAVSARSRSAAIPTGDAGGVVDPKARSAARQRIRAEAAGRVPRRPLHPDPEDAWCAASTSTSPRSRRRPGSRSSPNRARACGASAKCRRCGGGLVELAHRARLRGARSPGPSRAPRRLPRQESAGGHLGLLVRVPIRSARLAEGLRGAERQELRDRRRRAGRGRRSRRRQVVRRREGDVHARWSTPSTRSARCSSSSTCRWACGSTSSGRVVRPAEPAWAASRTDSTAASRSRSKASCTSRRCATGSPTATRASTCCRTKSSRARVKPRSPAEMEAEASFKLAVWFQQAGDAELARSISSAPRELNPDDWNYHRQEWSFTRRSRQEVAGEVQGVRQGVYPKLKLKTKGG